VLDTDEAAEVEAHAETDGEQELTPDEERMRRWRLILGGDDDGTGCRLSGGDVGMDAALAALYNGGGYGTVGESRGGGDGTAAGRRRPQVGEGRSAGLGASSPQVARWLGDIRDYFPSTVVQVMQRDAVDRLNLRQLLLEPELLENVEPDIHLVGTLLSLNHLMPEESKQTARTVVRRLVEEVEKQLGSKLRATVSGALDRSTRTSRPRHSDIDWGRTIQANLRNYLPEYGTIVPERLVGYARKERAVKRDVVLAIDQSGSMYASVVYASVFGAVLASLKSLKTSLVVFDTAVVDLTPRLTDPVDVLFGTQLGGGTDINRAIAYSQSLITRPTESIFILISDLYEGGVRNEMLRRVAEMQASGVQVIVLLALSDEGAPAFDRENASALAGLGVPAFACSPDKFGDLMAAAIERRDLGMFLETSR
jgi:Mg-chelatase subunit ChlD